jgi:hypothetical protein
MDEDIELLRSDAANHLLLAAHAIAQLAQIEDLNPAWADSRCGFFLQTADELSPSGEKWPEYTDNVVNFSQYMRQK